MTRDDRRARDEARIRTLVEDRTRALHAKDVAAFTRTYAEDLTRFDIAPPLRQIGAEALDDTSLKEWFSTFRGPVGYEVRDLRVTLGDDVAYCHCVARITGARTDGDETDVWVRETLGLRKIGDGWKVAHEHMSVPFYMDGSYKAAVDLEP